MNEVAVTDAGCAEGFATQTGTVSIVPAAALSRRQLVSRVTFFGAAMSMLCGRTNAQVGTSGAHNTDPSTPIPMNTLSAILKAPANGAVIVPRLPACARRVSCLRRFGSAAA